MKSTAKVPTLRPTEILAYESCGYAVGLKRQGYRSATLGYSLPYGTAVHRGALGYVLAEAHGQSFDPVDRFESVWDEELSTHIVEFSSRFTEAELRKMGKSAVQRFVDFWTNGGFTVYRDEAGEPYVERRIKVPVGSDFVLSLEPDVAAYDPEGRLGIFDLKTPAAQAFEEFAHLSDQLTAYQFGFEADTGQRVAQLGFWESLKQKRTQEVVPKVVPARTKEQIDDYVAKVRWIAADIANGRFFRRSAQAYNSPCALCEFRGYCVSGDTSDLVVPKPKAQPLDFAAA